MANKDGGGGGKDRGKSGQANARAHPPRLNGMAQDWAARRAGVYRVSANHVGTHKVRGAIGGMLAARCLEVAFHTGERFDRLVEESIKRAPVAGAAFSRVYNRLIQPNLKPFAA